MNSMSIVDNTGVCVCVEGKPCFLSPLSVLSVLPGESPQRRPSQHWPLNPLGVRRQPARSKAQRKGLKETHLDERMESNSSLHTRLLSIPLYHPAAPSPLFCWHSWQWRGVRRKIKIDTSVSGHAQCRFDPLTP